MSKNKEKKHDNNVTAIDQYINDLADRKEKERREKEMEEAKNNEVTVAEQEKAEVMVEEKKGFFGFLKDHKKAVIGGLVLTGLAVGGYYAYKMMSGNTTDLPLDEAAVDLDTVDVPFEEVDVTV